MKVTHKVELYRDRGGQWRWRAKARNGRIVADSGEGYRHRCDAERAWVRLHEGVVVIVETGAAK